MRLNESRSQFIQNAAIFSLQSSNINVHFANIGLHWMNKPLFVATAAVFRKYSTRLESRDSQSFGAIGTKTGGFSAIAEIYDRSAR